LITKDAANVMCGVLDLNKYFDNKMKYFYNGQNQSVPK
jgi:hypothetical protein